MEIRTVAFVGDYLPRKCGIATFTHDLRNAVAEAFPMAKCIVVAVNDIPEGYQYPDCVRFEIEEQNVVSYMRAADYLNNIADVVCVQHEYGIYGGPCGAMLLPFLKALRVPVVTTLHTILQEPSAEQRRILNSIVSVSARIITMAEIGRTMLGNIYSADKSRVDLVPHGIPDTLEFPDTEAFKKVIEPPLTGHRVILTFGLLSPNKGIEFAIKALPPIVKEFPDVLYVILGQTHPALIREHGESYRNSLEWLARDLGVLDNVRFVNKFVDLPLLKKFIAASDLYLTPYLHEAQITSGTLSYAFGMGSAVVSTKYWHAAELLAEGRGRLVPFRDAPAMAEALLALLRDDGARMDLKRRAFEYGRTMTWSNTAKHYMKSFEEALASRPSTLIMEPEFLALPDIKLDHFIRMTDGTGMLQHARFTVPDYRHGYCTDDNARALTLVACLKGFGFSWSPQLDKLSTTFAAFVQYSWNTTSHTFHNFMSFDRRWADEVGSNDCNGRAMQAMGACVRFGVHVDLATTLFRESVYQSRKWTSLRSHAFALLGIRDYLTRFGDDGGIRELQGELAETLMQALRANASPDWHWFEQILTYENAALPHALLSTGRCRNDPAMIDAGVASLGWLLARQVHNGIFIPIGNGWCRRGEAPVTSDQQPLEAGSTVLACMEAYAVTSEEEWWNDGRLAFEWFMGRNTVGKPLYNSNSAGCCDGLHEVAINQNEGAESILSFLMALTALKNAKAVRTPLFPVFRPDSGAFQ